LQIDAPTNVPRLRQSLWSGNDGFNLAGFVVDLGHDAVSQMNKPLVQDLAFYLLSRTCSERLCVGTTKLVKLFYLIDHEFYRWHRRTLTEAVWRFHHFGPYCEELVEAAGSADGIQPEPVTEFAEGKFFRGYRVKEARPEVGRSWPAPVRGIVDSVFQLWAPVELPLLLDYVYFETQPMLRATRFALLDFSVIPNPKEPVEAARDFSKLIPKEKGELLRRRMVARAGGYQPTKPMAVKLDSASESAFRAMGDED